jgi:HAD superfamily hydrolase (TIGR01509 family)
MYRAILFDFFDVIAPDFYRLWLEKNGHERTGEYLALAQDIDSGKIGLRQYYAQLSKIGGQSADSLREEFENNVQFNNQFLRLIANLHQNYRTALVTNSPSNLVRLILQKNNLERYFDEIIISGEVGYVKPDRKIFELALRKMNVLASETIFMDDLQPYIEGAEILGITGIRFDNVKRLEDDLRKCGVSIH